MRTTLLNILPVGSALGLVAVVVLFAVPTEAIADIESVSGASNVLHATGGAVSGVAVMAMWIRHLLKKDERKDILIYKKNKRITQKDEIIAEKDREITELNNRLYHEMHKSPFFNGESGNMKKLLLEIRDNTAKKTRKR